MTDTCEGKIERHPHTPENRYIDSQGVDRCRLCKLAADRRHYQRNRERKIAYLRAYRLREKRA